MDDPFRSGFKKIEIHHTGVVSENQRLIFGMYVMREENYFLVEGDPAFVTLPGDMQLITHRLAMGKRHHTRNVSRQVWWMEYSAGIAYDPIVLQPACTGGQ